MGGISLKMADVAATLGAAGFDDVRTVLASGNVVFTAPGSRADIRASAEAALRAEFDYCAWVLVYELEEVRAIAEGYPFAPEVDGMHSYVTFVSDAAVLDELAALAVEPGPHEKISRGTGVLYWQVPKSATLGSTIGKTMGKARYKPTTTTRNLRTLGRVLQVGLAG